MAKRPLQTFTAKVKAVNGYTCTVQDGDFVIEGVRLRTSVDTSRNAVILVPKVNSYVMVNRIGESPQYYVSMVSDVDEVLMEIDGKYTYKNNATSLKSLLNEILTEIKAAIITTPAGPGSMGPTTIAKLDVIGQKVGQLFKD